MQLFRVASCVACVISVFAATLPAYAGTITINSTAAPSASFCTLGQAIYAANLANNPTDLIPFGATTIAPLSDSVATTVGVGTCTGAAAGDNTIDLATYAGQTITFSIDSPDNFWYGPNALPPIASTITIEGHGATLFIQNGTSPRLRFFFVGADAASGRTPGYNTPGPGDLTLHNLTLTGGRQQGGNQRWGWGRRAGWRDLQPRHAHDQCRHLDWQYGDWRLRERRDSHQPWQRRHGRERPRGWYRRRHGRRRALRHR